jgi:hypothetical protein
MSGILSGRHLDKSLPSPMGIRHALHKHIQPGDTQRGSYNSGIYGELWQTNANKSQ